MGTHHGHLQRETDRRKPALACVDSPEALAEYIGGTTESLGRGEDWVVRKTVFPGVDILFVYTRENEEFPSNLRVLYSGERVLKNRGEDLAELTIACLNQMLRYVKETAPDPPDICERI